MKRRRRPSDLNLKESEEKRVERTRKGKEGGGRDIGSPEVDTSPYMVLSPNNPHYLQIRRASDALLHDASDRVESMKKYLIEGEEQVLETVKRTADQITQTASEGTEMILLILDPCTNFTHADTVLNTTQRCRY
jgi:hypothetical protein